ncbi:MAG: serine protease, partial [Sphingomonas bacterium]|nr:serine protease [Sphingomonas bacterium]
MRVVRGIWRILVGVKDALVLLLLLVFFGLLFAALSVSPNAKIPDSGALVLDLTGTLVEQPSQSDALALLSRAAPAAREYRLRDVIRSLDAAAGDKAVKAVVLDLDGFTGGGQATIAAAGDALDRVRRSGKPVLAFASGYTDDSYQLAAHASEVWLDPLGAVLLTGPGGARLYYKGLLDKLGITPKVYRVGEFKSAVEPYLRTDMSPEARAANQFVANALWTTWQQDVARVRPGARIAAYIEAPQSAIDAAGGDLAVAAQRAGLIDKLGDRIAFGRRVAELAGPSDDKMIGEYRAIPLENWAAAHPEKSSGDAIGVLTVAGNIVDGKAGPGTAGGDTIANLLLEALADKKLKALVVRVDSPGGSVTGSERIRTAILEARRRRIPVVVSMGSVAASGGYWVATAADKIIAERSTITGSIGVFGILPTFPGTLAKLGLSADGIKTTALSGEPDLLRGTSPTFDRLIQTGIDTTYRRFTGLVAQARHMTPAGVDRIGQGRIWDGATAQRIGLVDGFGGLEAAVAEAARLARVDPKRIRPVFIEEEPSFAAKILESFARGPDTDQAATDAFSRVAAQPAQLLAGALADARMLAEG